jgi:hypothetical protein
MTNNLLAIDIRSLAALCAESRYLHLDSIRDELRAELIITDDDDLTDRDTLIESLDRDIRDLLHNCNLDFLFSANDIDALDRLNPNAADDTHDMLSRRITADSIAFSTMIADLILAQRPISTLLPADHDLFND